MPKRRATGDTLTGGSRDVNPQFISGAVTLSGINVFTELSLNTPTARVGTGTTFRSVILELLKIFVDFPPVDITGAGATSRVFSFTVATASQGTVQFTLDNPRLIMRLDHETNNAFTAATSAMLDLQDNPRMVDLTDGDGHGVLIATDNVFIGCQTSNQAAASRFSFKLLYRFKEVSLVEYIGIVQSQQ